MSEQAASKETTMALTELYDKAYRSGLRDGQERMRERCAKECEKLERPDKLLPDEIDDTAWDSATVDCADAIRALTVEE